MADEATLRIVVEGQGGGSGAGVPDPGKSPLAPPRGSSTTPSRGNAAGKSAKDSTFDQIVGPLRQMTSIIGGGLGRIASALFDLVTAIHRSMSIFGNAGAPGVLKAAKQPATPQQAPAPGQPTTPPQQPVAAGQPPPPVTGKGTQPATKGRGTMPVKGRGTMPAKTPGTMPATGAGTMPATGEVAGAEGIEAGAAGAGAALAIVAAAALAAAAAISVLKSAADTAVERYAPYSPVLAGAYVQSQVATVLADFRRGQQAGPALAKYLQARTELEIKYEDAKMRILTRAIPILTGLMEIAEALLPLAEESLGDLADISGAVGKMLSWLTGSKSKQAGEMPDMSGALAEALGGDWSPVAWEKAFGGK